MRCRSVYLAKSQTKAQIVPPLQLWIMPVSLVSLEPAPHEGNQSLFLPGLNA